MGSEQVDAKPSAIESVRKWLNSQGYPLEFETARRAANAGLEAHMGLHFPVQDGVPRDLDVLAFVPPETNLDRGVLNMSAILAIECKYSRDKPWVVLCHQRQESVLALLAMCSLSDHAKRTLATMMVTKVTDIVPGALYGPRPPVVGYAVVQAHRHSEDNRDVPYGAITKVIDIAESVAKGTTDALRAIYAMVPSLVTDELHDLNIQGTPLGRRLVLQIVHPCIVVDAPIFAARQGELNAPLIVEEVPWARVECSWRGAKAVFVIGRSAFEDFLRAMIPMMHAFYELMRPK